MHKSAMKYNKTLSKWCKNKHGASKIIDMFETYQGPTRGATSRSLGIISAFGHIMNYFCPKSILIQFFTRATRNAH
jgi:hypothetical protein